MAGKVTTGIEDAVAKAREIAGDKDVGVNGGEIARQCFDAGLLDEVHVDLVPVFLGSGIPLLGPIKDAPVELEGLSRSSRERASRTWATEWSGSSRAGQVALHQHRVDPTAVLADAARHVDRTGELHPRTGWNLRMDSGM